MGHKCFDRDGATGNFRPKIAVAFAAVPLVAEAAGLPAVVRAKLPSKAADLWLKEHRPAIQAKLEEVLACMGLESTPGNRHVMCSSVDLTMWQQAPPLIRAECIQRAKAS